MLMSGADILRTTVQNAERAQRLNATAESGVKRVESPADQPQGSLDEDTKGALLRFARFIHHKDGQPKSRKNPPSQKKNASGLPKAYITQVENADANERSGGMINIYI
jgi:hypothetical protein